MGLTDHGEDKLLTLFRNGRPVCRAAGLCYAPEKRGLSCLSFLRACAAYALTM